MLMPGGVGDHGLLMHGSVSVGVSGAGGNGRHGTLTGGDPGVEVGVCILLIVHLGVVLLVVLFGMLVLIVWLLVLIV